MRKFLFIVITLAVALMSAEARADFNIYINATGTVPAVTWDSGAPVFNLSTSAGTATFTITGDFMKQHKTLAGQYYQDLYYNSQQTLTIDRALFNFMPSGKGTGRVAVTFYSYNPAICNTPAPSGNAFARGGNEPAPIDNGTLQELIWFNRDGGTIGKCTINVQATPPPKPTLGFGLLGTVITAGAFAFLILCPNPVRKMLCRKDCKQSAKD